MTWIGLVIEMYHGMLIAIPCIFNLLFLYWPFNFLGENAWLLLKDMGMKVRNNPVAYFSGKVEMELEHIFVGIRIRLPCTGTVASDVDIRISFNVSVQPSNVTFIEIRRKKQCLVGQFCSDIYACISVEYSFIINFFTQCCRHAFSLNVIVSAKGSRVF